MSVLFYCIVLSYHTHPLAMLPPALRLPYKIGRERSYCRITFRRRELYALDKDGYNAALAKTTYASSRYSATNLGPELAVDGFVDDFDDSGGNLFHSANAAGLDTNLWQVSK